MSTLSEKHVAKLREIVVATQVAGGAGYVMAKPGDIKPLLDEGLIEGNSEIKGPFGAIAWRATHYGVNRIEAQTAGVVFGNPAVDTAAAAGVTNANTPATAETLASHQNGATLMTAAASVTNTNTTTAAAAAPAAKRSIDDYAIETGIALPAEATNRKRGGARPDLYPFAKMEVGQSFFVPVTAEKPEPWKSLASTVNTAMTRFAVPNTDGTTRKNRAGETVAVLTRTRTFALVKGERGDEKGARVFRTA